MPPEQEDQLPSWEELSPELQTIVTKSGVSIKRWKFITGSLILIFTAAQQPLSSYYQSLVEDRKLEMAKVEKMAEANSNLNKVILDNLIGFSNELAVLKSENQSLKGRIVDLELERDKLKTQISNLHKSDP